MFHLTRRFFALLPLAWIGMGMLRELWPLPLPSLAMLAFLILRHRQIRLKIGVAPLASIGFARHVMVDDLVRLGGLTLASPALYALGGLFAPPFTIG